MGIYFGFSFLTFIVLILVGKIVVPWWFDIRKRNRYMKAQLELLGQIAAANGVSLDKIAGIIALAEIKD